MKFTKNFLKKIIFEEIKNDKILLEGLNPLIKEMLGFGNNELTPEVTSILYGVIKDVHNSNHWRKGDSSRVNYAFRRFISSYDQIFDSIKDDKKAVKNLVNSLKNIKIFSKEQAKNSIAVLLAAYDKIIELRYKEQKADESGSPMTENIIVEAERIISPPRMKDDDLKTITDLFLKLIGSSFKLNSKVPVPSIGSGISITYNSAEPKSREPSSSAGTTETTTLEPDKIYIIGGARYRLTPVAWENTNLKASSFEMIRAELNDLRNSKRRSNKWIY